MMFKSISAHFFLHSLLAMDSNATSPALGNDTFIPPLRHKYELYEVRKSTICI